MKGILTLIYYQIIDTNKDTEQYIDTILGEDFTFFK